MITTVGILLVVFVLLLFVQQMAEKIFPIVFVSVFSILLLYFWTIIWRYFMEKLFDFFEAIPYSKPLLLTVTILVIGDLIAYLHIVC